MNLIATVSQKGNVDVWRYNGQRVFGTVSDDETEDSVNAVAWRPDGRMLAAQQAKGNIVLIDSFTGKIAHDLSSVESLSPLPDWSSVTHTEQSSGVSQLSLTQWVTCNTAHIVSQGWDGQAESDPFIESNDSIAKSASNLPRALAAVDVELSLPKLSTLPPTSSDSDVFSTRTAVDSIFHAALSDHPSRDLSENVDVLFTRASPTSVNVRIFNTFEVGQIDLCQALPRQLPSARTMACASNTSSRHHYFVIGFGEHGQSSSPNSQLVRLDLRFLKQTSNYLPLVAEKSTQLQNLLRYLRQIQSQLAAEVRTAFDLPARFLSNIDEELKEHDSSSDFRSATFHLIVTGECDPRLKGWLVDQVGERGLKRWEKAVGDCLDMLRRMTSECLLPAIERSQVVLSRLKGFAKFEDSASRLGLDDKDIHAVQESVDVLTILCEDMLRDVCMELREFGAFIKWLKWEAEVEALEEDSERAEEMREAYPAEAELRTVLDYIGGPMKQSRILDYVESEAKATTSDNPATDDGAQFLARYIAGRSKTEGDRNLPKLGALLARLEKQTDRIFEKTATALRKNIVVSHVAELSQAYSKVDCQIVTPNLDETSEELHLTSVQPEQSAILQYEIVQTARSGYHKQSPTSRVPIQLPDGAEVLDAKFMHNGDLMVLSSTRERRELLYLGRTSGTGSSGNANAVEWITKHTFANGQMTGGLKPGSLTLTDSNDKQAVVVSDESNMGFVVLAVTGGSIGDSVRG